MERTCISASAGMGGCSAPGRALAPVDPPVGCPGSGGGGGGSEPRQGVVELRARADPELVEHLVQMPLDGAGAEVELRADLRVRPALAGQPGDELLLGREL